MQLDEIHEALKGVNARAKKKHGPWAQLSTEKQAEAIQGEYSEWYSAYVEGNTNGPHGEVAELLDVMNVAARRIMVLTGEPNA